MIRPVGPSYADPPAASQRSANPVALVAPVDDRRSGEMERSEPCGVGRRAERSKSERFVLPCRNAIIAPDEWRLGDG